MKKLCNWNSFTTPFFIPVDYVIQKMQAKEDFFEGHFAYKSYHKQAPVCPLCKLQLEVRDTHVEHVLEHYRQCYATHVVQTAEHVNM